MSQKNLTAFKDHWEKSVDEATFVRLTLSKHKEVTSDLKKVIIKLALVKNTLHYNCVYRHKTQDITKNYALTEGEEIIEKMITADFTIANLFTTKNDHTLESSGPNAYKLKRKSATFTQTPNYDHDKKKKSLISSQAYLVELGILSSEGNVLKGKGDKLKQINKFIEIIDGLIKKTDLHKKSNVKIYDMGSGKGYLTFGLYDYLSSQESFNGSICGVEVRPDLITHCNSIAKKLSFSNLSFTEGYISDFVIPTADILIALHACDTATDDAIYKGIQANAELIICSPCCHKQIRKEMKCDGPLADITTHGIMAERQAELVTDSIRALLLESQGYKTKVFEFISTEHTSKNLMIVGQKHKKTSNPNDYLERVKAMKKQFGIQKHYLETLLDH